jgi:hypothetical protein
LYQRKADNSEAIRRLRERYMPIQRELDAIELLLRSLEVTNWNLEARLAIWKEERERFIQQREHKKGKR